MKGTCVGCNEEIELQGELIRVHLGNEGYFHSTSGYICSGSVLKPVKVTCPACNHRDVKKDDTRILPHFDPRSNLLCNGEAVAQALRSFPVASLAELEAAVKKAVAGTKPAATSRKSPVIPSRPAYRPKIITRTADPATGDVTVTVPEEKELCQSGTKPRAGCLACGDMVYMTVTGREGQDPPSYYEDWRDEHDRFGLPWAKERMLDHMTDKHQGVLDTKWKPLPVPSDEPPVPVPVSSMTLSQIFGVPAVPFLLGAVTFFIISLTSKSSATEVGYMAESVIWFIFSGLIIRSNVRKFRRRSQQ